MFFKSKETAVDVGVVKHDNVLCDLDAIVDQRHAFKVLGKLRYIKPITTQVFFEFANGMVVFRDSQHKTVDELNAAFHRLMSFVTDDLSIEDVAAMEMVQKFVLLEHVAEIIMGQKIQTEALKKKTQSQLSQTLAQ